MIRLSLVLLLASAVWASPAAAQSHATDHDHAVAAAVSPLPPEYQEGAEVRVMTDGAWKTVRAGTNDMICLGDEPGDDRFHAACYHKTLEPFMDRGRKLRAEGFDRDAVQQKREEEALAGTLRMPEQPAALYSLSGPAEAYDETSMTVSGATPLNVVYMPYATTETTGLPARAPRGRPWLMNPGKPWAHIMLVPQDAPAEN